ncbi:MAG: diphthine--ammonia ligase, partial [Halobacteria archaeon]|nr:diphthine--ammonia ligase [Halobacteria archaeon]
NRNRMKKAVFSWSGGKDSAYAFHELGDEIEVVELLTTVSENGRSSMHGVRTELIQRQADKMGIPINFVEIPDEVSNDEYEDRMRRTLENYAGKGIETVVFADIHLEDVREYRENNLADLPLEGYWNIWGRDTTNLIDNFLDAGFRATTVCVNSQLGEEFVGRELDADLLDDLPDAVDPCGENGEFHTFVWDAPFYDEPIDVETGEVVERELGGGDSDVFYYCDLVHRP